MFDDIASGGLKQLCHLLLSYAKSKKTLSQRQSVNRTISYWHYERSRNAISLCLYLCDKASIQERLTKIRNRPLLFVEVLGQKRCLCPMRQKVHCHCFFPGRMIYHSDPIQTVEAWACDEIENIIHRAVPLL